jgi:hypothetical protein
MFVPIVRETRDDGAAAAAGNSSGAISVGIAGMVVRAETSCRSWLAAGCAARCEGGDMIARI